MPKETVAVVDPSLDDQPSSASPIDDMAALVTRPSLGVGEEIPGIPAVAIEGMFVEIVSATHLGRISGWDGPAHGAASVSRLSQEDSVSPMHHVPLHEPVLSALGLSPKIHEGHSASPIDDMAALVIRPHWALGRRS
jgi:hypothetical protein